MQTITKKLLILSLLFSFIFVLPFAPIWAQEVESEVMEKIATENIAMEKININTASLEELQQIAGIGPQLAQKVIDYREASGPFQKAEDIMKIKGIGSKLFEASKEIITVE